MLGTENLNPNPPDPIPKPRALHPKSKKQHHQSLILAPRPVGQLFSVLAKGKRPIVACSNPEDPHHTPCVMMAEKPGKATRATLNPKQSPYGTIIEVRIQGLAMKDLECQGAIHQKQHPKKHKPQTQNPKP